MHQFSSFKLHLKAETLIYNPCKFDTHTCNNISYIEVLRLKPPKALSVDRVMISYVEQQAALVV